MGILTCLCMMCFLPADTWIRLVLWMLVGLDIYASYGRKHSQLEPDRAYRKGDTVLNVLGLVLAVLSVITGLWHQQTVGWEADKTLPCSYPLPSPLPIVPTICGGFGIRQKRMDNK